MLKKFSFGVFAFLMFVGQFALFGCSGTKATKPIVSARPSDGPPRPDSLDLPVIQAALRTKEELESHRITLCAFNTKMDNVITQAIKSVPAREPDVFGEDPASAIKQLIETTAKLRLMAREILDQKEAYLNTLRSFEEPMERAPAELRRAAELFKGFSTTEPYEAFQQDYLVMSQMFTALASHYESQQERFDLEFSQKDFLETTAYLERGALMLDRFEAVLEVAKSTSQIPEAAYYVNKLKTFVREFESFRTKIRRVNKMLDESKPSSHSDPHTDDDNEAIGSYVPGRTARTSRKAKHWLASIGPDK